MIDKLRAVLQKFTPVDWILLLLVTVGLLLVGITALKKTMEKPLQVEYLAGGDTKIWVDVAGAVVKPGVYQLALGARIKDALIAAGGLAEQADRDFVAKVINLAAVVKDGEKVFVPGVGSEPSSNNTAQKTTGLININSASLAQLDTLWGVGASRAQTIVDGRPYGAVADLVTKKILPQNVYDRVKDKLSVY